jgi:hypothetical protein
MERPPCFCSGAVRRFNKAPCSCGWPWTDATSRSSRAAVTLSGGAALGSRVPELHGQEALAMERLTAWLAQVSLLSSQVLLVLDEIHGA